MNHLTKCAGVLLLVTGSCSSTLQQFDNAQTGPQNVTATLEKNHIAVTVGGELFTCYKFESSAKYPYFWPVNGPASGTSVTTETSEPYPHHHSLFFGCDRVNGGNYWQEGNERGQIVSQGPKLAPLEDNGFLLTGLARRRPGLIKASGRRVVFTDTCLWQQPGKEAVIRDLRRVTITAPNKDLRFIDFEISLKPLTDVHILKTNHSLFSARVVPELSVKSGGTLINAEGNTGEKETFGVASPWCDYSGVRSGVTEGIAIMQHPDNRWFPSKWFTRDYGFFSPTPMYWLKEPRHRFESVHTGDATTAGIQKIYGRYKRSSRRSQAQQFYQEILRHSILFYPPR